MSKKITAEHGVVCSLPGERFGYFGWPSIARMGDGTLVVASSGMRTQHVCPFGKTVLNFSHDDGRTWSPPRVINNSAIDDRDAGVVWLGGKKLLVTWFTSDTRKYADAGWIPEEERKTWADIFASWTDEMVNELLGSWLMLSDDAGGTWSEPVRVPVSTPHGPILLSSGDLLYLGKDRREMSTGKILAARSSDGGRTWKLAGEVPVAGGTDAANYHEPHAVELPSGRLIGAIRLQNHSGFDVTKAGFVHFSVMLTASEDGGKTWAIPEPMGFHGSPPHLLRHSSATLVMTYGYRLEPFGQRVALSNDDGNTWTHDWILRDDGPDGDLGYPATVEMPIKDNSYSDVEREAARKILEKIWGRVHPTPTPTATDTPEMSPTPTVTRTPPPTATATDTAIPPTLTPTERALTIPPAEQQQSPGTDIIPFRYDFEGQGEEAPVESTPVSEG